MPNAVVTRELMSRLCTESPPRSKKSSSTPTRSIPSTPATTRATARSVSVRGSTCPDLPDAPRSGAGSAAWSTFPFPVNGNASTTTNADGTR
jgi:hypothetical protein